MTRKLAGVTDTAVEAATGEGWDGWLASLDYRDATGVNHKKIVAILDNAGVENQWWQQQIAVGYEQARGMREVGETAGAGFEIGVQRTLPIAQDRLWELLLSADGRRLWLGDISAGALEAGATYETADGIHGELRTIKPEERLRLTWHPDDWDTDSTLQVSLACPRNSVEKTVLRFHQERLADSGTREAMREHWRAVLDRLEAHIDRENGYEER